MGIETNRIETEFIIKSVCEKKYRLVCISDGILSNVVSPIMSLEALFL